MVALVTAEPQLGTVLSTDRTQPTTALTSPCTLVGSRVIDQGAEVDTCFLN